jgi:glyoxylase-like metal-dependent hydrolase (beta-lactamase superfamily II)
MRVLNLTYKLTSIYLIEANCGWVMVDAGWPDTLSQFFKLLKQNDVHIGDIKYLIITHFHPDHAGLAQDLKELGTKLILHEIQVPFVNKLNSFFKKNPSFKAKDIIEGNNIILSSSESKKFLKSVGIDGEIILTPGHTDDSISLIIDKCCAFTGDLPEFSFIEAYNDQTMKDSWKLLQAYNVKKIYPAHGDTYTL